MKKQIKTIEDQGAKQVEALKPLKSQEDQELESFEEFFPNKMRTNDIKSEIDEIEKCGKK